MVPNKKTVGGPHMDLRVGDGVRVIPSPEVDETLWDEEGLVLDLPGEGRVVVELGGGGECAFNRDQLELVVPSEDQGPPSVFGVR